MAATTVGPAGCGMFDIREPVAPGGGCDVVPSRAPNSAENVLFNFTEAVQANRCGIQQYGDSLAEIFRLELDAIDVQELPDQRTYLCKDADTNAQQTVAGQLEAIMAESDSLRFEFGDVIPEETDTTAFYLDIPYELMLLRSQGDSLIVRGKAELYLAENRQNLRWEITRWVDKREDPATSIGRWHAENTVVPCP